MSGSTHTFYLILFKKDFRKFGKMLYTDSVFMHIMFCPKCGALMYPSGGKLVCKKCGYSEDIGDKDIRVVEKSKEKEVIVVTDEVNTLPVDDNVTCPKCDQTGAYYMIRQTRASDEPETRFYICKHCGYKWREY